MRTSSPDRPAVQLSVRTPNSPYFTATYEKGLCGYKAPS